jgi:hypothetical protein
MEKLNIEVTIQNTTFEHHFYHDGIQHTLMDNEMLNIETFKEIRKIAFREKPDTKRFEVRIYAVHTVYIEKGRFGSVLDTFTIKEKVQQYHTTQNRI